jgi:hypothetical protein
MTDFKNLTEARKAYKKAKEISEPYLTLDEKYWAVCIGGYGEKRFLYEDNARDWIKKIKKVI